MSEIKRVTLTTLEPQKVSDKVNKKQLKTVRITVCLPESNEDNCPEYNYKDQLAAVKKKLKQVKDTNSVENGLDPFENDDDVKRIALEMEAKYGTGMTGGAGNKRKRKGRKDDYADIGMGYDESDSFIDNTDGYDEIIPQNVTTLHGGFYINCGALEFKTDDEASSVASSSSSSSESSDQEGADGDGTDDEDKPKKSKKRVLDSSSSDSESAQTEKKPKLAVKTNINQVVKKKIFNSDKIQIKKKNPVDLVSKTVKDLLREKREDLEMSIPGELQEIDENVEKDSLKENKKPMNISSVTDAIESVVKQVVDDVSYDKNQNRESLDVNKTDINESANSQSVCVNPESSQDINNSQRQEVTKLPENLPTDILEIVNLIKAAGINYKGEGKKAFFTDEVNALLLNLERKCRVLGKSSRLRVYGYLSSFVVVCKKDTLMKRARTLILDQEESRLKKLVVELKDKIDYAMPALIANFELDCQNVLAKKFSKESAECEELKTLKMPRRKFIWTDELRKLIKDILSFKKRCLIREGKQKDKLEEQVVDYLRTVILPLWPEGWMYLNNLKKVYNSMTLDNNRSANKNINSSAHSTNSPTITLPPKNDIKSHIQNLPSEVTVHSVKPQAEVIKPPKDKPVEVTKSYSTKSEKLPSAPESSKRSKLFTENTVKAHADSSNSKLPVVTPKLCADKAVKPIPRPEDEPSDLSVSSRMYKPYADSSAKKSSPEVDKHSKVPEMFKPYAEKGMSDSYVARTERAPSIDKPPSDKTAFPNKPSDLSQKSLKSVDKSKEFSQFEMFKPYADPSPFPNNRPKEKGKSPPKYKETRTEGSSKSAPRYPSMFEDAVKEPTSVISKAAHCHGVDLTDRSRQFSPRSPDRFVNYQQSSTPKISKSEGDDIQMVMENLKALQKLSCSPIKNDNSSSSPVSVIAYNKNFTKGVESNNVPKGEDLSVGYQDEFQKQIISSLQQMQSNSGGSKPSYNNRCS